MSYQTILVHLDTSERCSERVRIASSLALTLNAHLVGVAPTDTGAPVFGDIGNVFSRAGGLVSEAELEALATQAASAFSEQVKNLGLRSYEARVAKMEASSAVIVHGRYADLVVVGQNDPDRKTPGLPATLAADVVEASPRPVLIIPYAGHFDSLGHHVAIGWNAGRESARAVADALPLLRLARTVKVLTFNAQESEMRHGELPGADLGLYLARHGVSVEVSAERTEIDTGSALLSRIADYGSDLVVMGAYSHSRLREAFVGGVTQTILDFMTVPILMSH